MYKDNTCLLRRIKEGDSAALDEIVDSNMGLVRSIALRFRDRGVELDDLIQIGVIGMIKAARSFDFGFHTTFSTYAVPLIIGEIRRFLRDDGPVKVSRTIKRQGVLILRAREQYVKENGREPRISELADRCGMSVEEAAVALTATGPVHSFDEPTGEDGATLGNLLSDTENAIDALTDQIALAQSIRTLPALWQEILQLRYGRGLSQEETGRILGLTQVKISREEKKILSQLRSALLSDSNRKGS